MLGKVDDETKREELEAADVLCAPSLGGESFGMVLTEAFAAGTPVVASDIAGYRDVVRDGVDGVLVPPADPQALAEALRDLYEEPARRAEMARTAATDVERFAWPRVAAEVMERLRGRDRHAPAPGRGCSVRRAGGRRAQPTSSRTSRAPRLPSLEPKHAGRQARRCGGASPRRVGLAMVSLGGAVLALLALQKIGLAQHRRRAAALQPHVRAARPRR